MARHDDCSVTPLFREEARLICGRCSGGRFAARNTYDAEHCHFRKRAAWNEDAIGGRVQVRRRDLQAVVDQGKQIIGDYTFESVTIREAQANPKPIELGAAKENFAFRLEIIRKLSDKIDRADFRERKLFVFTVRSEDVDRVGLAEPRWTEIAAKGFLVQKDDDNFLVRRGWGSVLQRIRTF